MYARHLRVDSFCPISGSVATASVSDCIHGQFPIYMDTFRFLPQKLGEDVHNCRDANSYAQCHGAPI